VAGLNWSWVALQLAAPPILSALAAYPLWLNGQAILGNIAGSAVIFASAFALIAREYVELESFAQRCLDQGFVCVPSPTAFTRYAVYAFIALFQIMALFTISLKVEARVRRRGYDPEWR
jgi:hypothetical protein